MLCIIRLHITVWGLHHNGRARMLPTWKIHISVPAIAPTLSMMGILPYNILMGKSTIRPYLNPSALLLGGIPVCFGSQDLAQSKVLKPLPPHNNRYSYFGNM